MPLTLTVIIVNYNVKYFLEQCLHAVVAAAKNIDAEIIVVDNDSTDGSKAYLSSNFATVQFLWNRVNVGFAKGNNHALALAKGKYILFLNPDTIVAEDSFEMCLQHFYRSASCGAIGVRMIDGAGDFLPESKRGFPSVTASFFKLSGLSSVFNSSAIFAAYYAGHLPQHSPNEVDVLSGACMMVPKAVLEQTGSFDEAFFMYGEDVDLSYRIQKAGYKNFYLPQTSIVHFKGESTQKHSENYVAHFYGAMQLFVQKHYAPLPADLMSLAIKMLTGMAKLKSVKKANAKTGADENNRKAIAICAPDYVNNLMLILKNASPPISLASHVAPELQSADVTAVANKINQALQQASANIVVFCIPSIMYKSCIELMQRLGKDKQYLWHSESSACIVGSRHKNGSPMVISKM